MDGILAGIRTYDARMYNAYKVAINHNEFWKTYELHALQVSKFSFNIKIGNYIKGGTKNYVSKIKYLHKRHIQNYSYT